MRLHRSKLPPSRTATCVGSCVPAIPCALPHFTTDFFWSYDFHSTARPHRATFFYQFWLDRAFRTDVLLASQPAFPMLPPCSTARFVSLTYAHTRTHGPLHTCATTQALDAYHLHTYRQLPRLSWTLPQRFYGAHRCAYSIPRLDVAILRAHRDVNNINAGSEQFGTEARLYFHHHYYALHYCALIHTSSYTTGLPTCPKRHGYRI